MIKTLQITSILAVILAVGLLVSSVVFGVHKDDRIEAFLSSPSVEDQFKALGQGAKKNSSQSSPLVDRAQLFARLSNPPKPIPKPPATPQPSKSTAPAVEITPKHVGAKFKVIGTSFCESNPAKSLVFIDEPGKGLHWVRQGSEVMRLTIEEVKEGRIVVRDAQGTSEIVAEERSITVSLLQGAPGASAAVSRPPISRPPVPPTASRVRPGIPPRPTIPGRTTTVTRRNTLPASVRSRMSREENAKLAALGSKLKAKEDASRPPTAAEIAEAEIAEAKAMESIKKLLADAKSESNNAKNDPNRSRPGSKIQAPPSTPRTRPR